MLIYTYDKLLLILAIIMLYTLYNYKDIKTLVSNLFSSMYLLTITTEVANLAVHNKLFVFV